MDQENEVALNEAREELVKLQSGDLKIFYCGKNQRHQYEFFSFNLQITWVEFDYSLGESFYRNKVDPI